MSIAALVLLVVALAIGLGALLRWATGIPRLSVKPSLHGGSTRAGTLYVEVRNRGRWTCRDLVVTAQWSTADGKTFLIDERRIAELAGRAAISLAIKDLHRGLPTSVGWDDIIIKARGGGAALAARSSLRLATRGGRARAASARAPDAPPAAVEYKRVDKCEGSTDGQHLFQDHDFENDGALEHWHVCRRCHVARRDPLTPDEERAQSRVRAERVARERRETEAEFARRERQEAHAASSGPAGPEDKPPRNAAASGQRAGSSWRERRADPEPDRLPIQVALWILGIDEAHPTLAVVDAAHKRLAKEFHPDRAPAGDAKAHALFEEKMRDINRARDRLREHLKQE